MVELFLMFTMSGIYGNGEAPQMTVSPSIAVYETNLYFSMEPTMLQWTPEEGFWLEYSVSAGPRIDLEDGGTDYYYYLEE